MNESIIEIEFSNRTGNLTNIWVEPSCQSLDLDRYTEYKVTSNDKSFRIEFDENNRVIMYCQSFFGCKIYKRSTFKENNPDWVLEIDLFEE